MGPGNVNKRNAGQGRRDTEKLVFRKMVEIYCRAHHGGRPLCSGCNDLIGYAGQRIDACRFGDEKSFCSACFVHCFQPARRSKVREIMRYSGPRMLLYHPVMAIRHFLRARD